MSTYICDISLYSNDRAKWQATTLVKIKIAETLDKCIFSYIGFKKFFKLGPKYFIEKCFKNLKAEINTIPL